MKKKENKYKLYVAIIGTAFVTTISGCNLKKQESTLEEYYVISEEIVINNEVNNTSELTNENVRSLLTERQNKPKVLTKTYKNRQFY